jgi:hypothetical protein
VIAEPFAELAVHETVADESPRVAVAAVGAVGTPAGVTAAVSAAAAVFDPESVATTRKKYDVPFARPVTTQLFGSTPTTDVHVPATAEVVALIAVTA